MPVCRLIIEPVTTSIRLWRHNVHSYLGMSDAKKTCEERKKAKTCWSIRLLQDLQELFRREIWEFRGKKQHTSWLVKIILRAATWPTSSVVKWQQNKWDPSLLHSVYLIIQDAFQLQGNRNQNNAKLCPADKLCSFQTQSAGPTPHLSNQADVQLLVAVLLQSTAK